MFFVAFNVFRYFFEEKFTAENLIPTVNTNLTAETMVLPSAVSFKTSFRFPTARWQDYVMINIDRGRGQGTENSAVSCSFEVKS